MDAGTGREELARAGEVRTPACPLSALEAGPRYASVPCEHRAVLSPPLGAQGLDRRLMAGGLQPPPDAGLPRVPRHPPCPLAPWGSLGERSARPYPLPPSPFIPWFPGIQPEPPTYLLLILIPKKFFFQCYLPSVFFPWLKMIGDETPAAWSPELSRKERWKRQ